ncbi:hypothetical protein [Oricola thermophila]|uniref:Flagellar protein FlgN n=1 Tax=Oricola thermophila TaxID=2742145 RepID=A0A6N1VKZ0_9HYPH|nr:hypothetical protein [Oricola thermophila]QKV19617.1 hypothetical protein HTY61_14730 [Oricola thermophila]
MKTASHAKGQNTSLSKSQLKALITRVGSTIEAETRMLRKNPAADISATNARKNRCLYELNLVSRELTPGDIDEDIRSELLSLRKKVDENAGVLRACMTATKDVIDMLGDAIVNAESDGTYPLAARRPAE